MPRVAVCVLVLHLAAATIALGQDTAPSGTGNVSGTVLDKSNGDPIIEAGVEVVGTGRTVRTDLDGKYTLALPPGTYELRIFAPLYQGARLERVVVTANKIATANASLSASQAGVEVVEVVAEAAKAAEATQLLKRKKAPVVSDNIAAETIAKSPDSDAAEVVQRVPAVTIKDDKFIFVRGLSERFSGALVERSRLPSTDPDRRIVPLDLFPADFLDSISIIKSYTPDLPGDFAGGLAEIGLREFPERLKFGFGVSIGANTETTFQKFNTYKGGGLDYFGFDQNVRSVPTIIPERNISSAPPAQRQAFGRSFKNIWEVDSVTAPPNFGVNFAVGNTIGPFGFNLAGTYTTEYKMRDDQIERQFDSDGLREDYRFDFSTFETRLGGLFTTAYQLSPSHRFTFRSLYNRNTSDEVAVGRGTDTNIDDAILDSTAFIYTDETLAFGQLAGEHRWTRLELDWRSAFSRTTQEVPDQRLQLRKNGSFDTGGFDGGTRNFGDLTEYLTDSAVDFTIPFSTGLPWTDVWDGLPAKFKFGPAYSFRKRDSTLRIFKYTKVGAIDVSAPTEDLFDDENIGRRPDGFDFGENTFPQNTFKASEETAAGYAMFDLPLVRDRLRFIAGVRPEYSYISLDTFDGQGRARTIIKNNLDPLPSINLVYSPRGDMNVRLGWSRTVSRPEFRELSPAIYPAPRGLRSLEGNPDLVQSDVESFDLRWEWFFSPSELVSLGGFYKDLDKPIELIVKEGGGSLRDSFANSESATLAGFEFEGRKNLGFIAPALRDVSFQTNVSYIHSNVTRGDLLLGQLETSTDRPLQGQAPFVVNAALEYAHPTFGTARLLYNTIGRRIAGLGTAGVGDIFEERRDQLDLVLISKITPFGTPLTVKFAVENILNDQIEFTQEDAIQREYETGTKFSLGFSYSY